MDTYYVRHNAKLDIDDATRQKLWDDRRIAIHYPQDKHDKLLERDNSSLNLADYASAAQRRLSTLIELAKNGGYVCAEYHQHTDCLLGYIKPGSAIELIRGVWGSRHGLAGREAILKTLRLDRVKVVSRSDSAVILVGRPQQGTICRWKVAGKAIENAVEGRRVVHSLGDLFPTQQEIMCSEFLRSPNAAQIGLPTLAHLLLPVGRTMRGVDIYGISASGSAIFAQVTYLALERCGEKLETLRQYGDGERTALVLFCDCSEVKCQEGVQVIPLRIVYDSFVATAIGKMWLKRAASTGDLR